mmetsp:Transcript_56341/g.133783  ORF Transcript_56341/g.133783 Transcript_56341/m.133783 type:complete len:241 (-) Transcript_56341:850-1572(-)
MLAAEAPDPVERVAEVGSDSAPVRAALLVLEVTNPRVGRPPNRPARIIIRIQKPPRLVREQLQALAFACLDEERAGAGCAGSRAAHQVLTPWVRVRDRPQALLLEGGLAAHGELAAGLGSVRVHGVLVLFARVALRDVHLVPQEPRHALVAPPFRPFEGVFAVLGAGLKVGAMREKGLGSIHVVLLDRDEEGRLPRPIFRFQVRPRGNERIDGADAALEGSEVEQRSLEHIRGVGRGPPC